MMAVRNRTEKRLLYESSGAGHCGGVQCGRPSQPLLAGTKAVIFFGTPAVGDFGCGARGRQVRV